MDPASRLIIKKNEKLVKSLNIDVLKQYLINSQIFTSAMLEDIFNPSSDVNLFSELPSRGPRAFSRFLKVLDEAGYEDEANNLRNDAEYVEESEVRSVFYPMRSHPLGYCIIINNVNFYKNNVEVEMKRRGGSHVDAKRLREFFEKIGYVVEEQINLKCEEIKKCLKDLAKSDVTKIVNCCFVIILSHGSNNDVVCDTHFSKLRKKEVYDIFNNLNCENLRNKPKVIMFQACRGEREDDGILLDESSDSLIFQVSNNDYPLAESTDAIPSVDVPSIMNSYGATKLPTLNDIFVIHSSLPDHASYLDRFNGSWLVQDLLSVFMENYLTQDIESMIKIVNRKIRSRLSLKNKKKQVIHTENFGFRALFHICSSDDYKGLNKNLIRYLY